MARAGGTFLLRPFKDDDIPAIARLANNRLVWQMLSTAFPHPYTEGDALRWIASVNGDDPVTHFCIEVDGEAAGAIGYRVRQAANTAELGYWLGEPYWGKGIATAAVATQIEKIFSRLPVQSITARVYANNNASIRVLQKNRFRLVGWLTGEKDGSAVQELIYARSRD